MFEDYTFEYLMNRALSRVSGDVDKRQGSVIYDALAPACAELCQAYIQLDRVIDETFADTASREYLIKRAKERGLELYSATYAIVLADLKGNFKLNGGERFNLDEVNYFYIGEKEGEYYKLKCETAGGEGNNSYGSLIPIDNISGLESAEVVELFYAGEEEEETESFRKRYFASFESQAFGGNITDYKEKMQKLNEDSTITNNGGIGGVKVYPVWNGGGTVKLVFTDKGYGKPSDSLVNLVQTAVMPTERPHEGVGFAPIGHNVTVEGVGVATVNINVSITFKTGYSWEDVKEYVLSAVEEYFSELRRGWCEETDAIQVKRTFISVAIINGDKLGCIDNIKSITLNGAENDLKLDVNEIPMRGDFIVT